MPKVLKAIEMQDVKIDFLSTVERAANKRQWVIAKSTDGNTQAKIQTSGRIIKSDETFGIEVPEGSHLIIGPVYEPLVEDAHGNFMTEDEIQKAAQWFIENGTGSDIQHTSELNEEVTIVKNWILEEDLVTKDYAGNEVVIKKGSWMAGALVKEGETWEKIEKQELTGWSMGGVGIYIAEEVDLAEIQKSAEETIIQRIAKALGLAHIVEKGEVTDKFVASTKRDAFWNAFSALENVVHPHIDDWSWERTWEQDETKITEALREFSEIMNSILLDAENISLIVKGLKPSAENIESLKVSKREEGDSEVNAEQLEKIVKDAVAPLAEDVAELKKQASVEEKPAEEVADVEKSTEDNAQSEELANTITAAVAKALEPVVKDIERLKQVKGISKQVEIETPAVENVQKSVFAGVFSKQK